MARKYCSYTFSIFGIVAKIQAPTLEEARSRLLLKWLRNIDPDRRHHPLVPPIFLLETTDVSVSQVELRDGRIVQEWIAEIDPRAESQAASDIEQAPDVTNVVVVEFGKR